MTRKHREHVLDRAAEAVNGSRNDDYGEPFNDFSRIAHMWTALFDRLFTPEEVSKALICVKLGRLSHTPSHEDSWIDIAGYAACGYDAYLDSMVEFD